jgi:Ca2+-binding RTX toxin-like protein
MARIIGTSGDDVLRGTSGRDVIKGRGGDDIIKGKGGKDKLIGGSGDDVIKGQKGRDTIKGNNGDDELYGNKGKDKIIGAKGDDDLYGGSGPDLIFGGKDADDMWGGTGDDIFRFKSGDGFHTRFPNTAVPVDSSFFDDIVYDFAGIKQGGADRFDTPNTVDLAGLSGPDGTWTIYGDGASMLENPVGSFFVHLSEIDIADFF